MTMWSVLMFHLLQRWGPRNVAEAEMDMLLLIKEGSDLCPEVNLLVLEFGVC